MHRCKLTNHKRIAAVKEYLDGHGSYETIARKYDINKSTLYDAVNLFNSQGEQALYNTTKNMHYSPELKRQAVEAYLSGKGSQQDICNRFHIRSRTQLRNWIRLYNGHNEFRSYTGHGSDIYMTKGRTTTLEERIEIVKFCIEHGKDYSLTIQQYDVSYNQIYSWVRKYKEMGIDGLVDRRGKAKPESKMTEIDRLKAENRILKAKLRSIQLEEDLRKKLAEIERRRR